MAAELLIKLQGELQLKPGSLSRKEVKKLALLQTWLNLL